MRRFAWVIALSFLCLSTAAAGDEAELKRLYGALNMLNQEQQAVSQQFQMLQELRRDNAHELDASKVRSPQYMTEVPNYSDIIEAQKNAIRRSDELAREAQRLYERYSEIEVRKKPLLQQIYELSSTR